MSENTHRCKTCQITFEDRTALRAHLVSPEHRNNRKGMLKSVKSVETVVNDTSPVIADEMPMEQKPAILVEEMPLRSERIWPCNECSLKFTTENELKIHEDTLLHIQNIKSRLTEESQAEIDDLFCRLCREKFSCKETYDEHILTDKHKMRYDNWQHRNEKKDYRYKSYNRNPLKRGYHNQRSSRGYYRRNETIRRNLPRSGLFPCSSTGIFDYKDLDGGNPAPVSQMQFPVSVPVMTENGLVPMIPMMNAPEDCSSSALSRLGPKIENPPSSSNLPPTPQALYGCYGWVGNYKHREQRSQQNPFEEESVDRLDSVDNSSTVMTPEQTPPSPKTSFWQPAPRQKHPFRNVSMEYQSPLNSCDKEQPNITTRFSSRNQKNEVKAEPSSSLPERPSTPFHNRKNQTSDWHVKTIPHFPADIKAAPPDPRSNKHNKQAPVKPAAPSAAANGFSFAPRSTKVPLEKPKPKPKPVEEPAYEDLDELGSGEVDFDLSFPYAGTDTNVDQTMKMEEPVDLILNVDDDDEEALLLGGEAMELGEVDEDKLLFG